MQGYRLGGTGVVAQASRSDQLCEELRVMLHLVMATELCVFILERVVTVRARCHDFLHLVSRKRLDIALRKLLIKKLIADSTRGITGTRFLCAEHGEINLCLLQ